MSEIIQFETSEIRRVWDEGTEQWYFAVVDVIAALVETDRPSKYWSDLQKRTKKQSGVELSAFCGKFPLKNLKNNRTYQTDCANREGIFRILQSVPSSNVEPIKLWLARVGNERIEQIYDPSRSIDQAWADYRALGYSDEWIAKRLQAKDIRRKLTDEWGARGVEKGREYAILTAEISRRSLGVTPSQHKKVKGLKREPLRDHMTDLELVFTMLGEASTTAFAKTDDAQGFDENKKAAQKGGAIAGNARLELEEKTGEKVVTPDNFLPENDQPSLLDDPKKE